MTSTPPPEDISPGTPAEARPAGGYRRRLRQALPGPARRVLASMMPAAVRAGRPGGAPEPAGPAGPGSGGPAPESAPDPAELLRTEWLGLPGSVEMTTGGVPLVVLTSPDAGPLPARRENLRLVLRTLEEAGIAHFVVRGHDAYAAVVGVRATDRPAVTEALREACRRTPAYLSSTVRARRTAGQLRPGGLPESWERFATEKVVRITQLRADRPGGEVYDTAYGCDIEFWNVAELTGELVAPRPNKVTTRLAPTGEPVTAGEHLFTPMVSAHTPDRSELPTRPEFLTRLPDEFRFPVDAVYTWVDGEDAAWQRRKAAASGAPCHPEADGTARFTSREELRYSLRSLHLYAPWIRHVYLVTDRQVPAWLDTAHPGVTVVDHSEIFSDPSWLPTFNSRAIESQLHHIDGLSEHFLYFNDDMLLSRPVLPEQFFTPNGLTRFFLSRYLVPLPPVSEEDRPVNAGQKNNRRLIQERFGTVPTQKLKHTPYAVRRSVLEEIEKEFPDQHRATAASPFRSHGDIAVPSSLHHYYAFHTGRAVEGKISLGYVELGAPDFRERLAGFLETRKHHVLCLNESGRRYEQEEGDTEEERARAVGDFLRACFPQPCPFEKTDAP